MCHISRDYFFELVDSGLAGRGTARAEDAHGTPTQSHISPSILVYKDYVGAVRFLGHSHAGGHLGSVLHVLYVTGYMSRDSTFWS